MGKVFKTIRDTYEYLEKIGEQITDFRRQRTKKRIEAILATDAPPFFYDDETLFNKLQSNYLPLTRYRFTNYPVWQRATQRATKILSVCKELQEPGAAILDIGAGDGTLGVVFEGFGHRVTLNDIDDWRSPYAKNIKLEQSNIYEGLPIKDEQFDLVVSFNTFEHLPDPQKAFAECVRLCKPNGFIWLSFSPLYFSPFGLHVFNTITFPYPQFLFSNQFLDNIITELGIHDLGKNLDKPQYVNQWKPSAFKEIFGNSKCKILRQNIHIQYDHLDVIHKYPEAFRGKNISFEDLTTSAIEIILRKL